MSDRAQLLLDEHVGRVFERVLRERGYHVDQAKDLFGERTTDTELLQWCGEHDAVLVSNNAKDFEPLHQNTDHAGLFLYYNHDLPDDDPEGLARTVETVFRQYDPAELSNSLVALDEWYDLLHG